MPTAQYPNKECMGWTTCLEVSDPEGDQTIHEALKGGMPKSDFCTRLGAIMSA